MSCDFILKIMLSYPVIWRLLLGKKQRQIQEQGRLALGATSRNNWIVVILKSSGSFFFFFNIYLCVYVFIYLVALPGDNSGSTW